MDARERTRDIYEVVGGYPPPPLIPLPASGDAAMIQALGIKATPSARRLVAAMMALTGFTHFQRQLPPRLEKLLRTSDLRGSYLFAPTVAASLALIDDPRPMGPLDRAATLIIAAQSLYADLVAGQLPPDMHRDQALEMGQYPNLFATSLIVEGQRARIFKSADVTQIAVVVSRRIYVLTVGAPGAGTPCAQLRDALEELVRHARRNPLPANQPPAGLLTAADHGTQLQVFGRLQQVDTNAESLHVLRHTFLTLCLDLDAHPDSYARAAAIAQIGNPANRWYHASLQIVVFGNAKACVICNFSAYLDGNVMMRSGAELQRRGAACPIDQFPGNGLVPLPPARALAWNIDWRWAEQAERDVRRVRTSEPATFDIPHVGRHALGASSREAIPLFIVALQMAASRLLKKPAHITQFLTMSRYRCMDLTTADVTTTEVMRFVRYIEGGAVDPRRARELLRAAVDSQEQVCHQARQRLPFEDLHTLFLLSCAWPQQLYAGALMRMTTLLLRAFGLFKPAPREILVSHPTIYPEVPVVGRPGVRLPYLRYFGLHYQIFEDRIRITLMPSTAWTISNAALIAELQWCLEQIHQLIAESREVGI